MGPEASASKSENNGNVSESSTSSTSDSSSELSEESENEDNDNFDSVTPKIIESSESNVILKGINEQNSEVPATVSERSNTVAEREPQDTEDASGVVNSETAVLNDASEATITDSNPDNVNQTVAPNFPALSTPAKRRNAVEDNIMGSLFNTRKQNKGK